MGRGVGLRLLLFLAVAGSGALLLGILIDGIGDGIAGAFGVALSPADARELERSVRTVLLVRGAFILLALSVLGILLGRAVAGAFDRLRAAVGGQAGDTTPGYWLTEARALGEALERDAGEWASHLHGIARERAELDLLIGAVSEGIVHVSRDRRLLRANPAARRLLSLPADAEGRTVETVVRSPELRVALLEAAGHGALAAREVAFEDRTLVVTARPLEVDGQPAGSVVAVADLTQLRRLESVRRDFVANASHELKTPLTSIRGYAETLLSDDLPEPMRRQFLETIHSNADRLQRIIDDLLDLSRLESGRWEPDGRIVQVAELAAETWGDFASRAERGGVRFEVQGDADAAALADPSALRQVFSNLFDNALRYTPRDGRIRVSVAPAGARNGDGARPDMLAVEVSDTGAGIPGDALPRIFERFYRVDPARSRAEGGTGLGLSIVKHLVESMGGAVEADSRLGRGTTVRVLLPAGQR